MNNRPRIKIVLAQVDKTLELTCIILLLLIWAITFFIFPRLPDTIPIHFGASGQPDGFGNKISILFPPILASAIYFILTLLNRYPHQFNYMVKITEANAEQEYSRATRTLRLLKFVILIIFLIDLIATYLVSIGKIQGLGNWFLPFLICMMLIPVGYLIIQGLRSKRKVK